MSNKNSYKQQLIESILDLCDQFGVYYGNPDTSGRIGWGWPDTKHEANATRRLFAVRTTMAYALDKGVLRLLMLRARIKRMARAAELSWAVYERAEILALATARTEALNVWVKVDENHPILAKIAAADSAAEIKKISDDEERKPRVLEEWQHKDEVIKKLKDRLASEEESRYGRYGEKYSATDVLRMLETGRIY